MALTPGTRIGPYEVLARLGAGGMGEIYRARDTRLGREVAIKSLPEAFAQDRQRVARFEREAQILAALNHPHIATLHGLEEVNGARVLVLELVEGESLADRLARSGGAGLDLQETLAIAGQIIEALQAAHEKGIVHRDLKPANIMISRAGDVKVLDFGLARIVEAEADTSAANSPTLTFAATQMGIVLGTAAYMSPEQARGRPADKRSDVWAVGCVLFEMLAGKRPFDGEDVSDTLAAVLRSDPDWRALPANLPAALRDVLRGCLEKDPKKRIRDLSVVQYVLCAPATAAGLLQGHLTTRRRWAGRALLVALMGGIALTGAAVVLSKQWTLAPASRPLRFSIPSGVAQAFWVNFQDRSLVFAPDSQHLAYIGVTPAGTTQLFVLPFGELDSTPLAGTTGVRWPFFSPDGRWIGFFSSGELRRISVNGGPSMPICRVEGGARGATWLPDDTIVFASSVPGAGLQRVAAAGGEPQPITKPDTARGEAGHIFPAALPDGRAVLFTVLSTGRVADSEIAVVDLATGEQQTLARGGSQAEYVSSGHLVYAVSGTLRAARFDPDRRRVLSDPVLVADDVMTLAGRAGAANFTVSRQGHLVYLPASMAATLRRGLVWVTRDGGEETIDAPWKSYAAVRISPDGTRAALDVRDEDQDIWILEFGRSTPTRLTFDPALDAIPLWAHDGRRILFQSARVGPSNLFWQAADGTGEAERLTSSPNLQAPVAMSEDGAQLVIMELVPRTGQDLFLVRPGAQTPAQPLVQSTAVETNATLSPGGRWLAYQSDESGVPEVYVRPFPNVNSGRWQISSGGGSRPVWARSGRELFYLDAERAMMSVTVQGESPFRPGAHVRLFPTTRYYTSPPWRSFDVSPDGKRFLMIHEQPGTEAAAPSNMIVVLNWAEELRSRVPAGR